MGVIGRVTTNSRWCSCDRDAVLQPEELLGNCGRDVADADSATHLPITTMQRLIGNFMAVQPVAALVHAMICEYAGRIPGLWSPPSVEQSRASSDAASLQHPSQLLASVNSSDFVKYCHPTARRIIIWNFLTDP